jgi:hypothetical protein
VAGAGPDDLAAVFISASSQSITASAAPKEAMRT